MVAFVGIRLKIIANNYLGNGCNYYIYSGNGCIGVKCIWKQG